MDMKNYRCFVKEPACHAEDIKCQFNPGSERFLARFNSTCPLRWDLGVAHFLPIIGDTVALDCILNRCWNFHVPFMFWSCGSRTNSLSNRENPRVISCIVNFFSFSVMSSFLLSLFVLSSGHIHIFESFHGRPSGSYVGDLL